LQGLYDRGWSAEQVRQLLRLLDWMLWLPEELDQRFRQEMYYFEEERRTLGARLPTVRRPAPSAQLL
jgi:hypothetical protein